MSPVVGRESEIAVVESFLIEDDRRPRTLAIVGEPGIGKTTLWEEAVRLARGSGAVVLVARPAESEAQLSFAGLTDLLSPVVSRIAGLLPAPQREALDVVLLRAEADRPPNVVWSGRGPLARPALAAERSVVVAVDDVHWLDRPSSTAVDFALRRLADQPVRVIVSLRTGAEGARLSTVDDERAERLELGPLSLASLHRVIVDSLGQPFPRPTLVRIAQASGGNPLYALEIARLLAGRGLGRQSEMLPVPEDLRTLVAGRVRSLPADARWPCCAPLRWRGRIAARRPRAL